MLSNYSSRLPHLVLHERLDEREQEIGAHISSIKGVKLMKSQICLQRTNQEIRLAAVSATI
jgi:hypothetical protein